MRERGLRVSGGLERREAVEQVLAADAGNSTRCAAGQALACCMQEDLNGHCQTACMLGCSDGTRRPKLVGYR